MKQTEIKLKNKLALSNFREEVVEFNKWGSLDVYSVEYLRAIQTALELLHATQAFDRWVAKIDLDNSPKVK